MISALLGVAVLAVNSPLWRLISEHLTNYSNDWATAGAALAAFALAVWQYRRSVEQTMRDFRWRQAEKAKELSDELLTGKSMEALNLIDYPRRGYKISSESNREITRDDVLKVLRLTPDQLALPLKELEPILGASTEQAMFIRDCFDDLLNKLDRIYALHKIEYIWWDDIAVVLRYYLEMLRKDQPELVKVICVYCTKNGNVGARKIIIDADGKFQIHSKTETEANRPDESTEAPVPIRGSKSLM